MMRCSAVCRKYEVFEIVLDGPKTGNPYTEHTVSAFFHADKEEKSVFGFYDGCGIYKIRFMPSFEGTYSFTVRADFLDREETGSFQAVQAVCRGPVRVQDTYHFGYEDGTVYRPLGTTCYVWHLESRERRLMTLASLTGAGFNKLRFCVFPKHYAYNLKEPPVYPYIGRPADFRQMNEENFLAYYTTDKGNSWDFTRFNAAYFQLLDECVQELAARNIEADLILFHPYDRWGFSHMTKDEDDLYVRYMIHRYGAYHNVWWALANEYDLLADKSHDDWVRLGSILAHEDPFDHLRSIHNCREIYDHREAWATHCSLQRVDLYKGAEETAEMREKYHKPVIYDELGYEGCLPYGWGNLTAEELVRRFWECAMRGGYPGHSETYCHDDKIWWSHGGSLRGESWKRIAFLDRVMSEFPGGEIAPLDSEWDSVCAVPEKGKRTMYVFYYSFMRPSYREFDLDPDTAWHAEVLDTWNMTIEDAGVHCGRFRIDLPARPYMAIRLKAVKA